MKYNIYHHGRFGRKFFFNRYIDKLLIRNFANVILKRQELAEKNLPGGVYMLPVDEDGFYPLDIGKAPIDLFNIPKLNVTDLTLPYCELLTLYEKCLGQRRVSPAMAIGTQVHASLEQTALDNANIKIVDIPDDLGQQSKEEGWAQKVIGQITNLRALKEGHRIRELYVHGDINGFLVTGYIDEVNPESGLLHIIDTKTRVNSQEPELIQQLSAYHQVQIYHEILRQMTIDPSKSITKVYSAMGLDPDKPFSVEFKEFLHNVLRTCYTDLKSLEADLMPLLQHFEGQISDTLKVEYLRKDGQLVGEAIYKFDESSFSELVNYSFGFWKGTRPPLGVQSSELYKCFRCSMRNKCKWSALLEERVSSRAK
jgi:Exonuclease V - a 5' deoxyribonuclease